jgi:hypothetical protein
MKTIAMAVVSGLRRLRFRAWVVLVSALVSFVSGSLVTGRLAQLREVRADSDRVFELMIYHTVDGKVSALESIFRDVSKLQSKHNLNVVGYWVPNQDLAWKNTFIYVIAHPSRQDADANWQALHADPDFPPYRKAAEPLIEQANGEYHVDEVFMRPTDFSAMK